MAGKEYSVSKRAVICWFIGAVLLFIAAMIFVFGYHARGITIDKTVKKLEECEKAKKKPQQAVKKPQIAKRQVAKRQPVVAKKVTPVAKQAAPLPLAMAPAPVPLPVIPRVAAKTGQLTLRINVVEWSQIFEGRSLMSRDIGALIRKGLADGTVKRVAQPLIFNVNGAIVTVQGGQVALDPGQIGPETVIVVRSLEGAKFASPPNGLPLTTNPGELYALVKQGVSEIWLNFILDP